MLHGAPAQLSILPLALLPLCIGAAVVRAEFLGVTVLLRRRTLRAVVSLTLLAGVAPREGEDGEPVRARTRGDDVGSRRGLEVRHQACHYRVGLHVWKAHRLGHHHV